MLIGLYVGDDIREYRRKTGLPVPGKGFLQKKSYLYHGLRRAYHRIRGGGPETPVADPEDTRRWTEIFERYGERMEEDAMAHFVSAARSEIPVYAGGEGSKIQWSATEAVIRDIRDQAGLVGANTAMILLPTKRQVLRSEWEMTVELLRIDPGAYDLDGPQRRLMETAGRLEIPVLDLLPVFRSAPEPDSLYWPWHSHWRPAAHALAADAIYEFLAHEDLLKP